MDGVGCLRSERPSRRRGDSIVGFHHFPLSSSDYQNVDCRHDLADVLLDRSMVVIFGLALT